MAVLVPVNAGLGVLAEGAGVVAEAGTHADALEGAAGAAEDADELNSPRSNVRLQQRSASRAATPLRTATAATMSSAHHNVALSSKQMVVLAARTENSTFRGVGFKAETPLFDAEGASYKAYFGLVPA
jgi:hypothetical protein